MFRKKQIIQPQMPVTYANWEQDFGFLTLMMTRNINMQKAFFIDPYVGQLDGMSMLKDEDIEDSITQIVEETYTSLSDNYINFLVSKYFKDRQALLSFISDHVYVEVLKNATSANKDKIAKQYQNKIVKKLNDLNTTPKKESQ